MRLGFVRPHGSIDSEVTSEKLPDFLVISGPNGSGKSHLLEAIAAGAVSVDGETAQPQANDQRFRLFSLAQFVLPHQGPQSTANYGEAWIQIQQQVAGLVEQHKNRHPDRDDLERVVRERLISQRILSPSAIDDLTNAAGARLIDLTDDDYRRHAPLLPSLRDPFAMGLGDVFLGYHGRWITNRLHQFLKERGEFDGEPLSDEDFEEANGRPPWDQLTEVFADIGMDYRFEAPPSAETTLPYEVKLRHDATDAFITADKLSQGEKTLAALALSVFTGEQHRDSVELPAVLLLDEVDASLHPSMAQSMLQVVERTFVNRYGLKVLLVTHSPTTVALAPSEALHTMDRSANPRLVKSTRDEALRALMVGLPTLSVSLDDRRQVLVEADQDAACYQELFRLVKEDLDSPFSLEFIPAGRRGHGGEAAVRHLVSELRQTGNTSVYGIVDRDEREQAPEGVVFINNRDAIETLILDPVAIGLLLLREKDIEPEEMGLSAGRRHFEIDSSDAQIVATWICNQLATGDDDTGTMGIAYAGGATVNVPRFYLDCDGHALEERLKERFPQLHRHQQDLLLDVIRLVFVDAPDWIPDDALALFREVLTAE